MVASVEKSFILTNLSFCQFTKKNGKNRFYIPLAKKKDFPETSKDFPETSKTQQSPIFPVKISSAFLAQSVVAVFGLGFIDAGYSGDWSRIGVISKESEDLLKVVAFLVVPLCLFFIVNLSKERER